jgi:hypothetical protein
MSPSRAISAAGTFQDRSSLVSILAPRQAQAVHSATTATGFRPRLGKEPAHTPEPNRRFCERHPLLAVFLRTARARGFFANGNAASDDHRPIPRRHGTTSRWQSCHAAQDAVVRTLVTGSRKSRPQRLKHSRRCARKTPRLPSTAHACSLRAAAARSGLGHSDALDAAPILTHRPATQAVDPASARGWRLAATVGASPSGRP